MKKADDRRTAFRGSIRRLRLRHRIEPRGIQSTIMAAFTAVALCLMLVLGLTLYSRFTAFSRQNTIQTTQQRIEQTQNSLEDYLHSMRQISDAVTFNIIQDSDAAGRDLEREMTLIYESYKDSLLTIALYNSSGSLLAAEPIEAEKTDPDVAKQPWFIDAMDQIENMHFSVPHVQNLFDDSTYSYHWVISLSRAVNLTDSSTPELGVLLVDMNYSAVARIMEQINQNENGQYYYLADSTGKIIYHPKQMELAVGLAEEDSRSAAGRTDGVYTDRMNGEKRNLVISTIGYTGWRLVGVIPERSFTYGIINLRDFIIMLMLLTVMLLLIVNRVVSGRISKPILMLSDSVRDYEAGGKPEIFIGGSAEISHLGYSIQKSYEQIDELMKEIVREQNERRRSELDALQSQINPHFLYNTLDSITWMIEGGRNEDAVFMISELAKLLRISLSKGHTIIPIEDELRHSRCYMNIQKVRYRDRFAVVYDVDPSIGGFCTVKLILQPILENAIYYGVGEMDPDDGGTITVRGWRDEGGIGLSVTDNGPGMEEGQAEHVLTDSSIVHRPGSGVGLRNVDTRIRLLFGRDFGLTVVSEQDVGTTVTIRLPAIAFSGENRNNLETGRQPAGEET